MKKDNKKALYESIMSSVAKEVKKALNEYDGWTTSATQDDPIAKYCGEYIEDEPGDRTEFIRDAGKFGCKVTFETIQGYEQIEIVGPIDSVKMLVSKWYGPEEVDMIELI